MSINLLFAFRLSVTFVSLEVEASVGFKMDCED